MRSVVVILSFVLFFVAFAIAHETCASVLAEDSSEFTNGSQHADCDYVVPDQKGAPNATEHQWDLDWIRLAHDYAITNMPSLPFGACLVDSRTNKLVAIGTNMFNSDHPLFSHQVVSHAETVVITNATIYSLPDTWNATTGRRKPHPDWKFMTLYGNIEACPMCSQGAIWRGLRRMVFGARASVLQAQRCWTQPSLTTFEVVDHSSFATFSVVRGPMAELENEIVQGFAQQCKTPTPTPTPTTPTTQPTETPTTTPTSSVVPSGPFTCTADFRIFNQPPNWPNGLNAALSVYVSDQSALVLNGQAGWEVTFSTTGFRIDNSWGVGRITSSIVDGRFTYTVPNTNYNPQNPTNLGFTAYTTVPAPGNNICGISINGVICGVTPSSDASVSC